MTDMTDGVNSTQGGTSKISSLADRVANGAFFLWLASVVFRMLQFGTTIILARLLSPTDYGVVAIATTVAGLIFVLSNLQISTALVRLPTLTQEHIDTAFTIGMLRGIISTVVLVAAAYPAGAFMNDARVPAVVCALSIIPLIDGLSNPNFIKYARNLQFAPESMRKTVSSIVGGAVTVFLAIAWPSYWALVAGTVFTSIVSTVYSYFSVSRYFTFSLARYREILSFGGWLLGIGIFDYINGRIDYVLIGRGLGFEILGAYHIGQQITVIATGDIVAPLSAALLPAFAILSTNAERIKIKYSQLQSATLAIALPIGVGVSALSGPILYLLAGPKWIMAAPVIAIIAPIVALQTLGAGVTALALSLNKGRLLFIRTIIFLLIRSCLMVIGFYFGGYYGILYARLISGIWILLYELALAAHFTSSKTLDPLFASWRSIVSAISMWLFLSSLPIHYSNSSLPIVAAALLTSIFLGAGVYLIVHFVLWRISGYPDGAERILIAQIARIKYKLSKIWLGISGHSQQNNKRTIQPLD